MLAPQAKVYVVDVRLAGAVGQASHVDTVSRRALEVGAAVSVAIRASCRDRKSVSQRVGNRK